MLAVVSVLQCSAPRKLLRRKHLAPQLNRLRVLPLFREAAIKIAFGDLRVEMLCPDFRLGTARSTTHLRLIAP